MNIHSTTVNDKTIIYKPSIRMPNFMLWYEQNTPSNQKNYEGISKLFCFENLSLKQNGFNQLAQEVKVQVRWIPVMKYRRNKAILPGDFDMFDRTRESEKIIDVLVRGLRRQTWNFYSISPRIHVLQKSQEP